MKKSIFIAALIFSCLSIKIADAQIRISLNIGSQPEWGPTGYDHADYYYMPDIDAYYDVNAHQYVYYENNVWVRNVALPPRYHFDRYHSYKVVVNQPTPWVHHADIRARYASYRGRHDQTIIRESHDERYRKHWHDNGNHYGQQKEHGDRGHGHDKDRGDKGHDRD